MALRRVVERAHARNLTLFVAALWLLAGLACKSGAPGNQRPRPDALIVLPGATDVRETDENAGTIAYRLNERFPALPIIQTISNKLEAASWRPLENHFLDPGSSSSAVRRWESYEDRSQGKATQVYRWSGQWQDDSKRIVWYEFTYDAVTESDGRIEARGPLKVTATLLSAEAVNALQEIAKTPPLSKQ